MPVNRFYTPHTLEENLSLELSGEEHLHLRKVIRAEVGDTVEVADGQGQVANAKILDIDKTTATLEVNSIKRFPRPSPLILYLGLIKQNLLEWVVEKVTEIGVTQIILFPSAKSHRDSLSDNHYRRLNALLISALKQSGRAYLPKLEVLDQLPEPSVGTYYGSFGKQTPHLLSACMKTQVSAFLVGPESGLTKAEEKFFQEKGVLPATLGVNTLRAETAAITSMSLIASANVCKS